jgi:hypothetical protein
MTYCDKDTSRRAWSSNTRMLHAERNLGWKCVDWLEVHYKADSRLWV